MPRYFARVFNPNNDRSRLWSSFINTLRQNKSLTVGFSLWWIWIFSICQSFTIFPVMNIGPWRIPTGVGPLICIATTLLVTAALYRKRRFILQGSRYYLCVTALMSLGAAACFSWIALDTPLSGVGILLWLLASVFIGSSSAFMYIEFNRIMGWFGLLRTLFFAAISVLVGSSLTWAASALSPLLLHGLFIAMPICMTALLLRTLKKENLKDSYFAHGNDAALPIPLKFILTSFTEGLSNGLAIGGVTALGLFTTTFEMVFVGHTLAITLLVIVTFVIKFDFNRLIYQVAFPLMGFGFLMIGCNLGGIVAGEIVQLLGYCFLDLLLWGLGSYLIKNAGLPAIWITACPSGALFSGLALGIIVGVFCVQALSPEQLITFFCLCSFALPMIALLLFNKSNFEFGWGTIKPGASDEAFDPLIHSCNYLANENSLTARERDILILTARNTSRKDIAEMLFVSENTIKTHTRNMYRKLFVTSRTELIALVERTRNTLEGN